MQRQYPRYLALLLGCALLLAATGPQSPSLAGDGPDDGFFLAAGTIRGVGTLGYGGSASPSSPPPRSYGGAPGDYGRGYEGLSPANGDPWHRESDFKARDYIMRHSPAPALAAPPQTLPGTPAGPGLPDQPLPTLPKPPLPGDRDMPSDSPTIR